MAKYKEYLLATNTFNEPDVAEDKKAIATLLTRLILLEPGTDPLHPTMGVGIVSKYRYLYPNAESELKQNVKDQINQFLPNCYCADVSIIYNSNKTVNLEITIDDTVFVYESEKYVPITLATIKNQ